MKEEIYTIPVMDGLNTNSECPFCAMEKTLEDKTIAYVLSPAYMEEDVRGETNAQGFCKNHIRRLYQEGNSLGLGLMLHSQLKYQHDELDKLITSLDPSGRSSKKLFAKKSTDDASPAESYRRGYIVSCYVCGRIRTTFDRYLEAFFMLYKKDPSVQQKLKEGKGFCFDHFLQLYETAGKHLKGDQLTEFRSMIIGSMDENLKRVEDDLEWFTQKFDYRYAKEPWKNSKDALPRTILKLRSIDLPPR
ncbi:MAG: hypothetical protein IJM83_04120 [Firmicutes bacterium]|nr:hypothetical protein [Bacillota bacterium]